MAQLPAYQLGPGALPGAAGPSQPGPSGDMPMLPHQLGPSSPAESQAAAAAQAPPGSRLYVVVSKAVSTAGLYSLFASVPGLLAVDLKREGRTGQSRVQAPALRAACTGCSGMRAPPGTPGCLPTLGLCAGLRLRDVRNARGCSRRHRQPERHGAGGRPDPAVEGTLPAPGLQLHWGVSRPGHARNEPGTRQHCLLRPGCSSAAGRAACAAWARTRTAAAHPPCRRQAGCRLQLSDCRVLQVSLAADQGQQATPSPMQQSEQPSTPRGSQYSDDTLLQTPLSSQHPPGTPRTPHTYMTRSYDEERLSTPGGMAASPGRCGPPVQGAWMQDAAALWPPRGWSCLRPCWQQSHCVPSVPCDRRQWQPTAPWQPMQRWRPPATARRWLTRTSWRQVSSCQVGNPRRAGGAHAAEPGQHVPVAAVC